MTNKFVEFWQTRRAECQAQGLHRNVAGEKAWIDAIDFSDAPKPNATCVMCGTGFSAARKTAKFCSVACRVKSHRKAPNPELALHGPTAQGVPENLVTVAPHAVYEPSATAGVS